MLIFYLERPEEGSTFSLFMRSISEKLVLAICKKFETYAELNALYPSGSLKILNPKIWRYKGTIYKLRVDLGKESARVLFIKTEENNLVLLHGFIKKTRKTPAKVAMAALRNYERLKNGAALVPLSALIGACQ